MPGPCRENTRPALFVLEQHITSLAVRHISLLVSGGEREPSPTALPSNLQSPFGSSWPPGDFGKGSQGLSWHPPSWLSSGMRVFFLILVPIQGLTTTDPL